MMRLPRPASPRALWRDIKALAADRSPHQLIAGLLAIGIPLVIGLTFMADVDDAHDAPEQIIYVESWKGDRSIEETRANIRAHEERRKAAEEERRKSFQRLEAGMNKLGIN
jgi:hypothetical protein